MATSLRKPAIGRVAPQTWTTEPEEHRRLLAEGQGSLFGRVGTLEAANETVTVTATTFTAGREGTILVDDDTAGGPVTVNLPPVATRTTPYHVKKLGTTGSVTVDGDGSETIDNSLTAVIGVQYDSIRLAPGDGAWWIT